MIERRNLRTDCLRIDKVQIENVQVDEDGDKKTVQRVSVDIGGDYYLPKARVHAWAFKFFPY